VPTTRSPPHLPTRARTGFGSPSPIPARGRRPRNRVTASSFGADPEAPLAIREERGHAVVMQGPGVGLVEDNEPQPSKRARTFLRPQPEVAVTVWANASTELWGSPSPLLRSRVGYWVTARVGRGRRTERRGRRAPGQGPSRAGQTASVHLFIARRRFIFDPHPNLPRGGGNATASPAPHSRPRNGRLASANHPLGHGGRVGFLEGTSSSEVPMATAVDTSLTASRSSPSAASTYLRVVDPAPRSTPSPPGAAAGLTGGGSRYLDFNSQLMCPNMARAPQGREAISSRPSSSATPEPVPGHGAARALARSWPRSTPGEPPIRSFFHQRRGGAVENAIRVARMVTGRHKGPGRYRSYPRGTAGALT